MAAAICAALAARGERVAAFKPAVSGLDDEPGEFGYDHELLASVSSVGQTRTRCLAALRRKLGLERLTSIARIG